MKCEKIRNRLSAFLDGEVKEDEYRRIASHLESCDSCSREYEELKHLGELLSNLNTVQPPPYLWHRVERKISSPEKVSVWEQIVHRFVYAPVGVAVLIGVLIGNYLGQNIAHRFVLTESEPLSLSNLDDGPPGSLSDAYFYGWEE